MSQTEYDRRAALVEKIVRQDMDRLRGRLCTFLEAMGLPDQQASAGKSMLKHHTYDSQRLILEALHADLDRVQAIEDGT